MTNTPQPKPRLDANDAHFYFGLILLFSGLWLLCSVGLALTVCGALLAAVGFFGALRSESPIQPETKR
ncbi:MAG: hypothetical protein EHM81_11380 [Chloroflexi bacterium]|nr:MAG: hypothetical protein EHM81_11380 [Chloroflexota bacterium]